MVSKSQEKITKSKPKHKKGLWSPEEDQKLRNYILQHGYGCWSSVPKFAGLQRNGKSCRLRWINYLRPGLKRGTFSVKEEETIRSLHQTIGNKWSQIAQSLPGRTDNEIKNYWHSHLKKKIMSSTNEMDVISKNELNNNSSTIQEDIESSNLKSNITISSLDSNQNMEIFAINSNQATNNNNNNNNQSCLPKIFFEEWFSLDDINPNTYNNSLDIHESNTSQEVTTFNISDEFFNGVNDLVFDSQIKFEDQELKNEFDELFFAWG